MEQKSILLSALSVGVGVGVGLGVNKWSSGGVEDGVTLAQIEHELFRLLVDGKDEKDTLKEFPYYLRNGVVMPLPLWWSGIQVKSEYGHTGGVGLTLMGREGLPIMSLSCLRVGGGRVSAHLREPRGWWRSSSRSWPQCPVSRWLARRSLPFKKKNGVVTKVITHRFLKSEAGISAQRLGFSLNIFVKSDG